MTEINFSLHQKQLEIINSDARFKVVAAGRRGGKTYLSCVQLLLWALETKSEDGRDLKNVEVWYIAPTFDQAKKIMWNLLKTMGKDLIEKTWENSAVVRLVNGRHIRLLGSDRPDTLRGVPLSGVVIDEYAFMKPDVWELIIRPTLSDYKAPALFIGTPDGKNHFYDLWLQGGDSEFPAWESFQFNSLDNPMIDKEEIEEARKTMTAEGFRQEYEASFAATGTGQFKEEWIQYADESKEPGTIYITVDPAGYDDAVGKSKAAASRLDECAIAIVEVSPSGWFVHEIDAGRWGVREVSLRILAHCQNYQPAMVGIESGSLKNALMPYLSDDMNRLGVYPHIEGLSHGGRKKTERITWALQGRFQNKRITLKKGSWNKKFVDQLLDFPNPRVHDDLLDALAYIDQVGVTVYNTDVVIDEYQPLDADIGY